MQVATITTAPDLRCFSLKNLIGIDVGGKIQVSFFMLLLCHRNSPEDGRDFGKSFFFSDLGESGIHLGMFVVFSGGRGFQVFDG